MSALQPKADMFSVEIDVGFVPIADVNGLGALVRFSRHEFERLGRLELARSIWNYKGQTRFIDRSV